MSTVVEKEENIVEVGKSILFIYLFIVQRINLSKIIISALACSVARGNNVIGSLDGALGNYIGHGEQFNVFMFSFLMPLSEECRIIMEY